MIETWKSGDEGSFVVSFGRKGVPDSAGPVAAVLKHALPEERRELAHVTLGELEAAVGSERRVGGGQHHLEQVPQVTLKGQHMGVSPQAVCWGPHKLLPPGGSGAPPPSVRLCSQTVSLEETPELPAEEETAQRSEVGGPGRTDGRPPGAAHLRVLQLQTLVHLSEAAVASEHRPHVVVHGDLRTGEQQIKASKRERLMKESSRRLRSPSLQTQSARPSPARGGSNEEC